jgi:hypothetical protein
MTESENSRPRLAGGIFIALGLLIGAIAGIAMNQPSAGMVVGLGVGSAIAIVIWLQDRKRG